MRGAVRLAREQFERLSAARSVTLAAALQNYPSTAPKGREGNQKTWGFIRHSSIGRTSARIVVLRVGSRRVSRVSLVRGAGANIGRGGGARVRTGPGGRLRLSFRFFSFTQLLFLDGNGNSLAGSVLDFV